LFIVIKYMLKNEIIKSSVKYFLNKIELDILKYFWNKSFLIFQLLFLLNEHAFKIFSWVFIHMDFMGLKF